MKVGTICKLKVDCLDNKEGTLGVVFYDYGTGFQAIFENGNYDGFSIIPNLNVLGVPVSKEKLVEAAYFLEEVGFEESLAGYKFQNVRTVSEDYRQGKFDIAWSERWKLKAALRVEVTEPEPIDADYIPDEEWINAPLGKPTTPTQVPEDIDPEFEKCEVYADGNRPAWLRFKRKHLKDDGVTCCMLSAAMDYADFSHFEYAEFPNSALPRWIQENRTLYPQYVVFRKKQ